MTAQATRGTAGAPRQMEGAAEVAGAAINALVPQMIDICGRRDVLTDPAELATYECDGLTSHRCSPGLVVLPTTAEQVAAIVAVCARAKIPFVARGSGTGLSGGALPRADGVLIVTSKMRRVIAIDQESRRAIVEPGVTNLAVSKAAEPFGLFYAPDPSSQVVVLDRRQRGGELRRGALPQERLHRASRDRPGGRDPGRGAGLAGRRHRRRPRL